MPQENNRNPAGGPQGRGTYPPSKPAGSTQSSYSRPTGTAQSSSRPSGTAQNAYSRPAGTAQGSYSRPAAGASSRPTSTAPSSYSRAQQAPTAATYRRDPSRSSGSGSGARPASAGGSRYASNQVPSTARSNPPEPPKNPPRRKKRGMGPLGALLYVVLVIGISALLAGFGWIAANDVLALNKSPLEAVVVVKEEDGISDVAKALKAGGIIEHKSLFKFFAAMTHASDEIVPGTYTLTTDMDYRALIKNMSKSSGTRSSVTVTVTEGMTLKQIFQLLEEKGVSTVDKLNDISANHTFKYSFLQDLPTGEPTRLEGYLFPDTYEFYMNGDPLQTINKMLLRFDTQFTEEMRTQAANMGYTVAQIVNIASMIEKETDGEDQTIIAQVIYNRLERPTSETAGYLNIDATIAYVTGQKVTDTTIDTPYNTAQNKGLPPSPISNPGMAAIYAALHPDSDYRKTYYYALGDDGVHHFFRTHNEQKKFTATQELYKNDNK